MDLTNQMKNLRDEVNALNETRHASINGIKSYVARMLADFTGAHSEMAENTRTQRSRFVSGVRNTVRATQQVIADDLRGAHEAWFGRAHSSLKPVKAQRVEESRQSGKPERSAHKRPR